MAPSRPTLAARPLGRAQVELQLFGRATRVQSVLGLAKNTPCKWLPSSLIEFDKLTELSETSSEPSNLFCCRLQSARSVRLSNLRPAQQLLRASFGTVWLRVGWNAAATLRVFGLSEARVRALSPMKWLARAHHDDDDDHWRRWP